MSVRPSDRTFRRVALNRNETISDGIFELEFNWTGPAPASGQFFLLRPIRSSVLLGRAISVYGWRHEEAPDGEKTSPTGDRASRNLLAGSLRFLIAERGTGTSELRDMRPGEYGELIGPLGNSWEGAAGPIFAQSNRRVALVGGGIGIAPLVCLAQNLPDASYDFYAGFRTRPYGLADLRPRKLVVATEDGSDGVTGRIPDFIEYSDYDAVFACGPEPMLRAVADSCKTAGVPALLSLERRMACGVGACLGCTVGTISGNRRCCADGPIFSAGELTFDD